jgi:hypothetical protein
MSLANEWADGEDSIQSTRNHHRSLDDGDNVKDQQYLGSHRVCQKGHRNRYTDVEPADMVAAGYALDGLVKVTHTSGAAVEALDATPGQRQSGVDAATSHHR